MFPRVAAPVAARELRERAENARNDLSVSNTLFANVNYDNPRCNSVSIGKRNERRYEATTSGGILGFITVPGRALKTGAWDNKKRCETRDENFKREAATERGVKSRLSSAFARDHGGGTISLKECGIKSTGNWFGKSSTSDISPRARANRVTSITGRPVVAHYWK